MGQPLDEVRGQPEVARPQLAVIFPFGKPGVGERLTNRVDQLVTFQLFVAAIED